MTGPMALEVQNNDPLKNKSCLKAGYKVCPLYCKNSTISSCESDMHESAGQVTKWQREGTPSICKQILWLLLPH